MDEYLLPPLPSFQVNEAYRPQKRKRGGLAGLWDRNKGLITTAAELAAGAVGGPGAASAVGALAKGLDRPGKRGIGLDVGQAARGGLEGYTMGKVGQYGAGKLKGLFSAAQPAADVGGMVPSSIAGDSPTTIDFAQRAQQAGSFPYGNAMTDPRLALKPGVPQMLGYDTAPANLPFNPAAAASAAPASAPAASALSGMRAPITSVPASAQAALPPSTYMPQNLPPRTGSSLSDLLSAAGRGTANMFREGGLIQRNPELFAGIAQGALGAYGAAQDRELARQEQLRQREQQARLAALLMPMYEQYYGIGG